MPVIAAKTALAATVATPKPPRIRPKTCCAARKLSRPISETLTKSPINTNSGTVAKTYSATVPWAASESVSVAMPKSRFRSARPANPISSNATAIGTPTAMSISTVTIATTPITWSANSAACISAVASVSSPSDATAVSKTLALRLGPAGLAERRQNCRRDSTAAMTAPRTTTNLMGATGSV